MRRWLQWLVVPGSLVILGLALIVGPVQSSSGAGPPLSCVLAPCKSVTLDSTLTDYNGITWHVHASAVLFQTGVGTGVFEGSGRATETGTGTYNKSHSGISCRTTVKAAAAADLTVANTVLGPKPSDIDLAMLPGLTSDVEHLHCVGGGYTVDTDLPGPYWYRLWILFHFGERKADGLDHVTGFTPHGKTQAIKTYKRTMPAPQGGTLKEHTTIIVDVYDPCRYTVKSATKAVKGGKPLAPGQLLGAGDQIGVHLGGSVTLTDDLGDDIDLGPGLYTLDPKTGCKVGPGPGPGPIPKKPGGLPIRVKDGSEKDQINSIGDFITKTGNTINDALSGKTHAPDIAAVTARTIVFSVSYNRARNVTRTCVRRGFVRVTAINAPGKPGVVVHNGCVTVKGKAPPRPG